MKPVTYSNSSQHGIDNANDQSSLNEHVSYPTATHARFSRSYVLSDTTESNNRHTFSFSSINIKYQSNHLITTVSVNDKYILNVVLNITTEVTDSRQRSY